MSYQVLARKWRPKSFQDIRGQAHVVRMLTNALTLNRIHHAYLFTGTRGVGKTTLARILAKSLNCESGMTATPCGHCHACCAIDSQHFLDLYEVDAASRTKVEDTRELLENVLYPPTQGRFKIYLIDEVHMLSAHSFNALLKTLEEPPDYVKFILATTDPKKLPITILSRCLQFHLKRITHQQITEHLKDICVSENIQYEETALEKLSLAADGSMRDALSLLDQAIAYGQGEIKQLDIQTMLSCVAKDDLYPLLDALIKQNGNEVFKIIACLAERAPDFHQLLDELISIFHQIAIAQIVKDALTIEASLLPFINQFTPEEIQLYYQIALLGKRDLAICSTPQQGFEMTMLRMLAFKPGTNMPAAETDEEDVMIDVIPQIKEQSIPIPQANTENLPDWRELLPKLELSGMAYALASNCTLATMTTDKVTLSLSVHHQPMLNAKLQERIAEALSRHLKRTIQLKINLTSDEIITPVKQQQSEQNQQLSHAKQMIMQNPQIKTLLEMYDATLEVSLV